jgi:hypothetical protein
MEGVLCKDHEHPCDGLFRPCLVNPLPRWIRVDWSGLWVYFDFVRDSNHLNPWQDLQITANQTRP